MPDMQVVEWVGEVPTQCQMCDKRLGSCFHDARTKAGRWGILCLACLHEYGTGLGTGKGQRYEFHDALGTYIMTAGGEADT